MNSLHPTESPPRIPTMGDRLLVALLTAWSTRLHEALTEAQDNMPRPRPFSRTRVWRPSPTPANGIYAPLSLISGSLFRPSPTELDDPDMWEWVETVESHPELQRLENLLAEFDETIDMLAGGGE